MNISILTLFPDIYSGFFKTSLLKRASEKRLVKFDLTSLFSFVEPKERVDGPVFGHGPGMIIRSEIVERAVDAQEKKYGSAFKVFFSPKGKKIDQRVLVDLYKEITRKGDHMMLLPARYEGMDARAEEYYADAIVSIGDFVLMGGDLPAMVFLEGLLRNIPGVVGKEESVLKESFSGPFVDHPHYTAPVEWKGMKVPSVVRSGNHAALQKWRTEISAKKTVKSHFDWLRLHSLDSTQKELAVKYIPPHYAALMHSGVILSNGSIGNSSVTSIDIHDIARSSKTFGLKNYFVVTPLEDQQKVVKRLLEFWTEGSGVDYNVSRHEAVKKVRLLEDLESVTCEIEKLEKKKPILIATSSREFDGSKNITYYDQEVVWESERPVLLLFGTAGGLGSSVLERCDYVLVPVEGFSSFSHLSVRSAAAIVLDRWLGINKKYL